jgi:hypothetical protein
VASEPPSKPQAGHAWLAHLRAEGRSVKTLYDRERNLFAIVFPHLADLGVSEPTKITSRILDQLAVALSEGGRTPATVGTYMCDVKVTYRLQPHHGGTRFTFDHAGFTGIGGFFMAQLLGSVRRKMLTAGLPAVLADLATTNPSLSRA